MNIQNILSKAAEGCTTNATSPSLIRPSKAGQPLAALVLENLVFSKLPQPSYTKSAKEELASVMSIAIGFVFEAAARQVLEETYPGYSVVEQPTLKWDVFVGKADYMLVSPDETHVVVVDCKAFGVASKREIFERKLTLGWGYPTQLAIYGMGASELYPNADIEPLWLCWCVPSRKMFFINQAPQVTIELAEAAKARTVDYLIVERLLEAGEYEQAAAYTANASVEEQLPNKGFFYNNVCATAPIHYSPYAALFYPETPADSDSEPGEAITGDAFVKLLTTVMHDAYTGANHEAYIDYLTNEKA